MKKYFRKVRDSIEISDNRPVIVTTDRVSAIDVVLSKTVPNKEKMQFDDAPDEILLKTADIYEKCGKISG